MVYTREDLRVANGPGLWRNDGHLFAPGRQELGGHPMTLRPPSSADPTNSCSPSPTRTGPGTGSLPTQSTGVSANLSFSPLILTENSQRSNAETQGGKDQSSGGDQEPIQNAYQGLCTAWRGRPSPAQPPVWLHPQPASTHNTRSCVLGGGGPRRNYLPPRAYPPTLPPTWAAGTGVEPVELAWCGDPRLFFRRRPGLAGGHGDGLHHHPQTPAIQVAQKKASGG